MSPPLGNGKDCSIFLFFIRALMSSLAFQYKVMPINYLYYIIIYKKNLPKSICLPSINYLQSRRTGQGQLCHWLLAHWQEQSIIRVLNTDIGYYTI